MTWYTANGDIQADTSSNLSTGNNGVDISAGPGALGGEHNAFNNVERTSGGLGSALDAGGGAIHSRPLQGTDTIADPNGSGMRTDLNTAVGLGWVHRNADGSFTDAAGFAVSTNPQAAPQGQPSEALRGAQEGATEGEASGASEGVFVADEATEQAFDAIATAAPGTQTQIVDGLINLGEVPDYILQRAASEMSVEPEDVQAHVETMALGVQEAALDRIGERIGTLDVDAFEAFVGSAEGSELAQQAARELMTTNDTTSLDELADRFAERMDVFAQKEVLYACYEAGIETTPDGRGGLLLNLPEAGNVPFRVAVRQGLISLSGNDNG